MKKRIWLFLLIFFPCSVFAKSEFSIKCDKNDKININEQVVCRVSVDSDFLFDNIKYEIKGIYRLSKINKTILIIF